MGWHLYYLRADVKFITHQLIEVEAVVSIGHSCAFYVFFVPLEYILSKPPHSTYVIVYFILL